MRQLRLGGAAPRMLLSAHGRLCEPEVHPDVATRTRGIGHHAVEHSTTAFVLVKAVAQKIPLNPSALGASPRIDGFNVLETALPAAQRLFRGQRIAISKIISLGIFQEGQKVAGRGMADSHHFRVLRLVYEFINPLDLRGPGKLDVQRIDPGPKATEVLASLSCW